MYIVVNVDRWLFFPKKLHAKNDTIISMLVWITVLYEYMNLHSDDVNNLLDIMHARNKIY